jgi:aryl-alcohol dehydrogenase-like predicted oxidoreductase
MERKRDVDRGEPVREAEREAAMKMRALGHNGPRVSTIGLGCRRMSNVAGPKASTDEEGIATIRAALDAGINFRRWAWLDLARCFGDSLDRRHTDF